MLKQSRSTKPVWMIMIALAILIALLAIVWLTINLSATPQTANNTAVTVTPTPSVAISTSPSGKYQVRFSDTGGLAFQTGDKTISLVDDPIIDDSTTFTAANVGWNSDESELVVTYVNITEQNAYIAFYKTDGTFINKAVLDQAFYGIDQDQAFPAVVSGDGKYIAVQTGLIHNFAIFDFSGNLVKTLATKYANVELFSDAMYSLENGTYSPFFDYKWNADNSGVLYRFQNTETFYEVKL